jgi:hypothetical protein
MRATTEASPRPGQCGGKRGKRFSMSAFKVIDTLKG